MNTGLKEYTKQITGNVGDNVKYYINVNSNDANLILNIPIFETVGINSIKYNLIYNHQMKNGLYDFGNGIRTSFDTQIYDREESGIVVKNPDGSEDEYFDSNSSIYYTSKTTTTKLRKTTTFVDGDSDIIDYELIDKEGNIVKFENDSSTPTKIVLKNGFNVYIAGVRVSNDYGAEISRERTNWVISKLTYNQSGVTNKQDVYFEYDSNSYLKSIKKYICDDLVLNVSFLFSETEIIITDELTSHAVKFTLNDQKIIKVDERFSGDYINVYRFEYYAKYSKIIDSLGNYLIVIFDDKHYPIYEYDNYGNCKKREYDSTTGSILSESRSINFKQLKKFNLVKSDNYCNDFTKGGSIAITDYTNVSSIINQALVNKKYKVSNSGNLSYKVSVNGLVGDIINLAMLIRYIGPNAGAITPVVNIEIRTYLKNKIVDKKALMPSSVFESYFDLVAVSLTATSTYDTIEFYLGTNNINIEISDILLLQKEFGTIFTYDEYKNVTDIVSGNVQSKYKYNSENLLEESVNEQAETNKYYYDNRNNLVKIKSVNDTEVVNTYSDVNLLKYQRTEGENSISTTANEYDSYGNLIKSIDSLNNVEKYEYDVNSFSKLKKVTSAISITEYRYKDGLINELILGDSKATYTYENRKIKTVTLTNGSKYEFKYDDFNNVCEISLDNVIIYMFKYDKFNNIIEMRYGESNNYNSFTYNNGLLIKISYNADNLSATRYAFDYDEFKRLISIEFHINNEVLINSFDYDVNNKLVRVVTKKNNVIESNIKYNYDNLGDINSESINTLGFEVNNFYDSVSRSSGSHSDNVYDELLNDSYYIAFFNEDIDLHGKNNKIKGYNKKGTYNIYTRGIIPHIQISNTSMPAYDIKEQYATEGTVGFWFKPKLDRSNQYLFVGLSKNSGTNYNLIALVDSNNQVEIKYQNSTGIVSLFKSTNKVEKDEWNFFSLAWKKSTLYLLLNGVEKTLYYTNDIYLPTLELTYYIANCGYSLSDSNPLNGLLTGLFVAKTSMEQVDVIKNYYMLTKEYLISKELSEDNCSLVNQDVTSELQIDSDLRSKFEIFPLNDSLLSLNGKKPCDYTLRAVGADKDRTFNFNNVSKRYAYVADGNVLAYKFGENNTGTIAMRIYQEIRSDKSYIFYSYNTNYNIGLFIDSKGSLYYVLNDRNYLTNLVVDLRKWHFVALSYNATNDNYGSKIDIRIVCDDKTYSNTLSVNSLLSNLTTLIGRYNQTVETLDHTIVEKTSRQLYGQIECLCFRAAFCEATTIDNLRNKIQMNNLDCHYNELGMLKKKDLLVSNTSILSNTLNYEKGLYGKETPQQVMKETIKCKNTITREYKYTNELLTQIVDDNFGSHEYLYNDKGYLIKDDNNQITYDENGNIKSYGSRSFEYNLQIKDRLSSVNGNEITYSKEMPLNPKNWNNNDYEFEGRRLIKYNNYEYTYDNQGLRLLKLKDNQIINKYYYNDNKLITDYRSSNDRIDFLYDINGLLYGFINNKSKRYYYIRDILQNILGIIDSAGNIVVKYKYDAYGNILDIIGDVELGKRNPFKYKGYYYDNESEMYYCSSRYYVPLWCRWLNADSVSYLKFDEINGCNLFVYCNNNPVMYSDRSGHSATLFTILIGTCIGMAANIIGQMAIQGKKFGEIDWIDVAASGVAGAVAGAIPVTNIASLLLQSTASAVAQNAYVAFVKGEKMDWKQTGIDALVNTVCGFAILRASNFARMLVSKIPLNKTFSSIQGSLHNHNIYLPKEAVNTFTYVFYNEISQIGSALACLSDFVVGYVGVAVNEFIKKYFS